MPSCSLCEIAIDQFYGKSTCCEPCAQRRRAIARAYRQRHPERIKESWHRWYRDNRDKEQTRLADWRTRNIERVREADRRKSALWRKRNPEKARASQAMSRQKRYTRMQETKSAWYMTPKGRSCRAAVNQRYRARKRAAKIGAEISPAVVDGLFNEARGACAYCDKATPNLSVDHVVSLRRGGAHVLSNLVIVCSTCNSSKADADCTEWSRRKLPPERWPAIDAIVLSVRKELAA